VTLKQSDGLRALGGIKSGPDSILCPGPGHGKRDASLSVTFGPKYPEGFLAYSFSGDDWRECRDYVRDKLGLPAWKPGDKQLDAQPVFAARSWVYENEQGDEHHRVDAMSDGTFRHYHFDIDGWAPNAPDLIVPYALPDVLTDETIWIVRGEAHADLIRDGFGQVATTYPSGLPMPPPASFLYHLRDRDVRILDAGGALAGEFAATLSDALDQPVYRLPDGFRTLRQYAQEPDASLDACLVSSSPAPVSARITPTPFEWVDSQAIKPRAWLYGNHLIRRFVSLTVSPGGIGKSSLVLMEALCMTSGRALLVDDKPRTSEPLRVWYWNGEDPQDETQRRVIAAAMHHKLTPDDVGGRLFTDTGREQTITLGQIVRGEISLQEDLFEELEREILARNIDVFILDPFVSAHRMGENDNNAIDAVVKRLGKLSERCNCAVEIVHHVRKPGGGSKDQTDVNDARGASALVGGVRSARVLNVMSEEIAAEIEGISPEDRFSYFTVTNGKSNMTKRSGEGQWRRLVDVDLLNGPVGVSDHVGVVEHYKLPKKAAVLDALPPNAVMIAQKTAYDNPMQTRLDVQSHDWFGHALGRALAINSVDKSGQETLKTAISIWVKSGALSVEIRPDAQRRPRQYLTCPASEMPLQPTFDPEDDSPF
jgi:hypothetical protein